MPPSIVITSPFAQIVAAEVHDAAAEREPFAASDARLPIPRATTAACEVIPPWTVRIPCAAIIPWMSSGVVS